MLRRLAPSQPATFAFTPANRAWAEAQVTKFPEGRQASAVIPILWRAQEQEGWLTRAAIEHVARMLDMAYIRALEVATFYFMFHLQPVGRIAHIQVCGTTSCMICGAEDLIAVCREVIAPKAHQVSPDGNFSWEEVECLGACTNAPMAQIGKDYYEDLTAEGLRALIARFAAGEVPAPGPQGGRFSSEPASGLTSLTGFTGQAHNASVQAALDLRETVKRIDGTEVPLVAPWQRHPETPPDDAAAIGEENQPRPSEGKPVDETGITEQESTAIKAAHPEGGAPAEAAGAGAPAEPVHPGERPGAQRVVDADGGNGDGPDKGPSDGERPASSRQADTVDDAQAQTLALSQRDGEVPGLVASQDGEGRPADDQPLTRERGDGTVGADRTGPQRSVQGEVDPVAITRGSKVVDEAPENSPGETMTAGPASESHPVTQAEAVTGRRPDALSAPREGGPDDLTRIEGIDAAMEATLNRLGIFHIDQIAHWSAGEAAWIDNEMTGQRGRVARDDWLAKARALTGPAADGGGA